MMMVRRTSFVERDAALSRLGQIARAQLPGDVSPQQESESRWRFRNGLANEAFASQATRWVVAPLAAAALLAALFFGWRARSPAPITFEVDSPAVVTQDYLLVPGTSPSAHVHFSDGSDLTLEPGARGRVAALRADGAAIGLEAGKATLHVVHRPETHWSVNAGPFDITVTGTAFEVGWSGADQLFEVTLHSGSVIVRGPLAPSGIRVAAGERLVVNLKHGQLGVERLATAADSAAPAPATATGETADLSAEMQPRKSSVSSPGRGGNVFRGNETKASWSKRVAAGDFDDVLAEAEQLGLDAALARSALPDLVALADAARYKGRVDVARRALHAQRDRFGSSSAARTAAFLLGRLSDSDAPAAIAWYDRYLAEAPTGEFASEALGRKLVIVHRVSGWQAARPLADEYLRRFPHGPYEARARELASQ